MFAQLSTYQRKVQKAAKCLRNFSRISSSDILGFFFCFSVFRVRASGGVVLVSVGEMGDVATSRVGVIGSGSITDRVYTCIVGARMWQGQPLLALGSEALEPLLNVCVRTSTEDQIPKNASLLLGQNLCSSSSVPRPILDLSIHNRG